MTQLFFFNMTVYNAGYSDDNSVQVSINVTGSNNSIITHDLNLLNGTETIGANNITYTFNLYLANQSVIYYNLGLAPTFLNYFPIIVNISAYGSNVDVDLTNNVASDVAYFDNYADVALAADFITSSSIISGDIYDNITFRVNITNTDVISQTIVVGLLVVQQYMDPVFYSGFIEAHTIPATQQCTPPQPYYPYVTCGFGDLNDTRNLDPGQTFQVFFTWYAPDNITLTSYMTNFSVAITGFQPVIDNNATNNNQTLYFGVTAVSDLSAQVYPSIPAINNLGNTNLSFAVVIENNGPTTVPSGNVWLVLNSSMGTSRLVLQANETELCIPDSTNIGVLYCNITTNVTTGLYKPVPIQYSFKYLVQPVLPKSLNGTYAVVDVQVFVSPIYPDSNPLNNFGSASVPLEILVILGSTSSEIGNRQKQNNIALWLGLAAGLLVAALMIVWLARRGFFDRKRLRKRASKMARGDANEAPASQPGSEASNATAGSQEPMNWQAPS